MELGICVRDLSVRELVDLGRFAEDHGYAEVYVPDAARGAQTDAEGRLFGRDAFCGLSAMFAATSVVRGAVGVAAVPLFQPTTLALLAATLNELSDGRFSLGIGVSHPEQLAKHDVDFPEHPVAAMREWLVELRRISADGLVHGGGWPVLLAALGPKMVELGATHADGHVLNWLTPEHTAASVRAIRDAAPEGTAPRTVLYLRLMPSEALRRDAVAYDSFANYHRHFLNQGVEGTDAIVARTTLPIEDLGKARERIEEYRASGLDLLCLYPHGVAPADRDAALAELIA